MRRLLAQTCGQGEEEEDGRTLVLLERRPVDAQPVEAGEVAAVVGRHLQFEHRRPARVGVLKLRSRLE